MSPKLAVFSHVVGALALGALGSNVLATELTYDANDPRVGFNIWDPYAHTSNTNRLVQQVDLMAGHIGRARGEVHDLIPLPYQSDLTIYGKDVMDFTVLGLRSM